jgi:hypothetical protein
MVPLLKDNEIGDAEDWRGFRHRLIERPNDWRTIRGYDRQ